MILGQETRPHDRQDRLSWVYGLVASLLERKGFLLNMGWTPKKVFMTFLSFALIVDIFFSLDDWCWN